MAGIDTTILADGRLEWDIRFFAEDPQFDTIINYIKAHADPSDRWPVGGYYLSNQYVMPDNNVVIDLIGVDPSGTRHSVGSITGSFLVYAYGYVDAINFALLEPDVPPTLDLDGYISFEFTITIPSMSFSGTSHANVPAQPPDTYVETYRNIAIYYRQTINSYVFIYLGIEYTASSLSVAHSLIDQLLTVTQYTVTVIAHTGGTTDPAPNSYLVPEGSVFSVASLPDPGNRFDHLLVNGVSHTENPYNFSVLADTTVEDFFSSLNPPADKVSLTITVVGLGDTNPAAGVYEYATGTTVTVSASRGFDHWTVNGAFRTENPITLTLTGNTSLIAFIGEAGRTNILPLALAAGAGAFGIYLIGRKPKRSR